MNLKELYLNLGSYLLSSEVGNLLTGQGLPAIAHVDLWREQPHNEDTEIAYSLPAVFIEFNQTTFSNFGVGLEHDSEISITFYLEGHTWGATAINAPNQSATLEPLAMFDAIQNALALYASPEGNRMFIVNSRFGRDRTNNPVSELSFTLNSHTCA